MQQGVSKKYQQCCSVVQFFLSRSIREIN